MGTALAQTRFSEWLAEKLREQRETPADLARGARVPQSSISAYLNQGTLPSMETAAKIAAHWGLEPSVVWTEVRDAAPLPASEDVIIPKLRALLAKMSPEEQAELALPAIEVVTRILRRAKGPDA